MALSSNDAFSATGGSGGRRRRYGRGRRGALSEINVTPLVDVMLVLLIVFMISAPLLTAVVPLDLAKTEAGAAQNTTEPLIVSVRADGSIFVQDQSVPFESLSPRLRAMAGDQTSRPIFVRVDGRVPYATFAQVMASLNTSGFSSINLVTDTGGPSSGARSAPAEAAASPAAER
jgi:biopolymer transport protein TolR